MLPALDEVVDSLRVVSIPLLTRFRGIEVREAALLAGPHGWSEFSPFLEYGVEEAAWWLAAAIESGWQPAPPRLRSSIRVNATVPAVAAAEVADVLARFPGCRTAKVKVAERGQSLADDVARVAATRAALGPEGRVRVDHPEEPSHEYARVCAAPRSGVPAATKPCALALRRFAAPGHRRRTSSILRFR